MNFFISLGIPILIIGAIFFIFYFKGIPNSINRLVIYHSSTTVPGY